MARAIWKGTLSFGLVSIGVELHSAEAPERLDLDMLDRRDMAPIGYQKFNKKSGKVVAADDIVKGFAVRKNRYVVLSDEDIKAANPVASRTVDILGFVDRSEIELIYFAKPYFVAPTSGSAKAYALLERVLSDSGRVALCRVVLHTREYVAALYPHAGGMVLQLLRYESELRSAQSLGLDLPKPATGTGPEYAMAKTLIESMQIGWKPSDYTDTYRDDLLKLIHRREKGAKTAAEPAEHDEEPRVLDLMAALRKSVSEGGRGRAHPPKAKHVAHRRKRSA